MWVCVLLLVVAGYESLHVCCSQGVHLFASIKSEGCSVRGNNSAYFLFLYAIFDPLSGNCGVHIRTVASNFESPSRHLVLEIGHDYQRWSTQLSNGAHIAYLDAGVPDGLSDYRTFIFVHGPAHNKCISSAQLRLIVITFEPVLRVTPRGFHGISISLRGYKGSTPLTSDEANCVVSPSQLYRTHITDFAAFIRYLGETLGVAKRSKDGTRGIITDHWFKAEQLQPGYSTF